MTNLGAAETVLAKGLAFLADLGFTEHNTRVEHSQLVGDSTVLIYASPIAQRQLAITYFRGSERHPRSLTIVVSAGKRNFLLRDFLRLIKREDLGQSFVSAPSEVDEPTFIENALAAFRVICDTDLAATLRGEEWVDVPFDWKGAK